MQNFSRVYNYIIISRSSVQKTDTFKGLHFDGSNYFFTLIFQIIIKMIFFKTVKKLIIKVDLFSSIQLLRFEGEAQTKTFTGGVISFAIIVYMMTTLTSMISDIFNKLVITSNQDTTQAKQPTPLFLQTTDNASHFMLGVEILNLDLTEGSRYFDVVLKNSYRSGVDELNSTVYYTMQPCKKQHWQGIPNISSIYDKIEMNKWLCMPMNISAVVQGKYSTNLQTALNIILQKCNNDTDPFRPCAPQQQIDEFLVQNTPAYFSPYFINTLINPQNKDYLSVYLQDRYYTLFGSDFGMEMYLYNAEYKITTDQSILPFSQKHTENGSILTGVNNNAYNLGKSDIYANINFYRDASTFFITRSYQTIEDAFSFVGGLLGSFLLVLVFVNFYNECSFQMKFATIYKVQPDSPNTTKNFNFIYYILQGIYNLLTIIKIKCRKPNSIKYFHQTRQEMIRQLDVKYLFRKLYILQNAMMLILTEPQIKGLMLQHQMTVEEAKRIRRIYGTKRKLKKYFRQKLKEKHQSIENQDDSIVKINMDLIQISKKVSQPQIANQFGDNLKEIQRPPRSSFSQKGLKTIQPYLSSQSEQQSSDSSSNQQNSQAFAKKIMKDVKALKFQSKKSQISKTIYKNLDPFIKHVFKMSETESKETIQHNTIEKNLQYGARQLLEYKQMRVNPVVQQSMDNLQESKSKEQIVFSFIQDQDN